MTWTRLLELVFVCSAWLVFVVLGKVALDLRDAAASQFTSLVMGGFLMTYALEVDLHMATKNSRPSNEYLRSYWIKFSQLRLQRYFYQVNVFILLISVIFSQYIYYVGWMTEILWIGVIGTILTSVLAVVLLIFLVFMYLDSNLTN